MSLGDYLTNYNEKGSTFTFPDVQTALRYVDEMTDDDWFVVKDRKQSDTLAKIGRAFR